MFTLEQCRQILGGVDCKKSDAEIELLRNQLYGLADVAVSAFIEQRRRNGPQTAPKAEIWASDVGTDVGHVQEPAGFQEAIKSLSEAERSALEERAAINEFDGGLDRKAAEHAAFCDWWRRKHRN